MNCDSCFPPRGKDQACTCRGCWACAGRVVDCTCDIAWDCKHEPPVITDAWVRPGMPESDYHALPHLGSTDIKRLTVSPAAFKAGRERPMKPSAAMRLGSALHSGLFGGPLVYRLDDFADLRTAAAQAAVADATTMGVLALPWPQHDKYLRMVDAVLSHPVAGPMIVALPPDARELSMAATINDVPRKARLDADVDGDTLDAKTTSAEELKAEALMAAAEMFGYPTQAVTYSDVRRAATGRAPGRHLILWVQSCEPHGVVLSTFSPAVMAEARQAVDLACSRWSTATTTGDWWDVPAAAVYAGDEDDGPAPLAVESVVVP